MRRIIPTVLLALVVYGNEAFAESKSYPAGSASTSCEIKAGTRPFHEGSVIIYGEMRVKILTEYGLSGGNIGPNYYSIFDIKAPRLLALNEH